MIQTFTTRFAALALAAAIVTLGWVQTVTVPNAAQEAALVTAVA